MKLNKIILTIFFCLTSYLGVLIFNAQPAYAQICTGSVNCKVMGYETRCEGGINDGEACSTGDDCLGGSCETLEVVAGRDTKGCNDNPLLPCRAGCQELGAGWQPDGGSCTLYDPPPPPPPPTNRYNCNPSTYTCYNAGSSGWYSTSSSCANNCKPSIPPPPQPEPDPDPPECTTCGCPGQPACSCTQEQQCGDDINQWECCDGACVPEGQCGPPGGPSCIASWATSNVWIRVVSPEGSGGTTAWKGTQANNPIGNTNWTVDGLDADGYFQTYKPYENGGNKVFDKTKNKIDSQMNINIYTSPSGIYKYQNECGETVTSDIPPTPPHGLVWSNHFCAAGWAWEAQANGLYPNKNRLRSGDLYYTEMTGSSSNLYPRPDTDGCWGIFQSPNDGDETVKSYHESLIPLLELADANHWADLKYDEYWSGAYQAWEYYENTSNMQSVIVLTPPTNHNCQDVRWWGKQARDEDPREYALGLTSNADGSCTIRFNPKKYDNLIIMELSAAAPYERCTVQLEAPYSAPNILTSDLTLDTYEGFNAHVIGESTEPVPPLKDTVNLWIAKSDFSKITVTDFDGDNQMLFGKFREVSSNGKYYYLHENAEHPSQNCFANGEQPCSMSVSATDSTAEFFHTPIWPEGTYHVFCDVAQSGSISNCSGNPACAMNNNGVGEACATFNDCEPDTLDPRDHATLTVACTPQCNNVCGGEGYSDGCGDTCPAGEQFGLPGTVDITDPLSFEQITSSYDGVGYPYNLTWTITEGVKTDNFDIFTYPQNKYADITAAENAYIAGADDVYFKKVTATYGTTTYTTAVKALQAQDWKITAAVRANNITCGTGQVSIAYENYDLINGISGTIKAVTDTNQCYGGSDIGNATYPALTSATQMVVTDTNDLVPYFTEQSIPNANISKGFYTGSNYFNTQLPFLPDLWNRTLTPQLKLPKTLTDQTYVCAACNQVGSDIFTCQAGGASGQTYVPQSNVNFYLLLFDLSNNPWWQMWGGNAYGKNGLQSNPPPTCTSAEGCIRTIIANLTGQTDSAGIPIAGGDSSIENEGSYFSENNNAGAANPRGHRTSINFSPVLENYSYFLVNVDAAIPASAANPASEVEITANITSAAELEAQFGSRTTTIGSDKIFWAENSLQVNLGTLPSGGKWNVPAGERWVIFVPGDLTFTGPTTDHTLATQQKLIQVANGGFLAFIAKGNITFDPNLGYGYDDDTSVASFNTPIVEGIYIASNNLIIQSKGGSTPGDYKFVGAGTFVGWTGINLERDFDNGGTRRSLNNTSPTDLFIYRPDFMMNAPEFMKKSSISWEEVN